VIRVSVVVPTFERAARLPGLVAALEAQTLPRDEFEVIISDDGSSDETPQVLEDLRSRSGIDLRVERAPQNGGAAAARNLGWRAARAPVIAFTDDDCVPAPGWLEAGLAALEASGAGIVQGRTLPDPSVRREVGFWRSIAVEEFSNRYETCNIFYRIDVLRETNGFDAGFRLGLQTGISEGEDMELGWRARRLGVTGAFAAEALVHHAVTFPGLRFLLRSAFDVRNLATMVRRFPEMRKEILFMRVFLARRHVAFLAALGGIAVAPFWLPALALTAPYLGIWLGRPPRPVDKRSIIGKLAEVPFDVAIVSGLAVGSIRERTLIL